MFGESSNVPTRAVEGDVLKLRIVGGCGKLIFECSDALPEISAGDVDRFVSASQSAAYFRFLGIWSLVMNNLNLRGGLCQ
jgi:hypothetical protein